MIDRLAYQSKLCDVSPGLKAIFSVVSLFLVIFAASNLFSILVFGVMFYACVWLSGLPARDFVRLCRIPFVFLIIGVLTIAFNYSQVAAGLVHIPFFHGYLVVTKESGFAALNLFLKSMSAISCLYFLYVSTPVDHLLGLMDKMHLPKILTEMMMMILRFIFILTDLMHQLATAQNARLGNRGPWRRLKSAAVLASSIFVKAFIKSDDIYKAMESRGYTGEMAYTQTLTRADGKQKALVAAYFAALLLALFALRLWGAA